MGTKGNINSKKEVLKLINCIIKSIRYYDVCDYNRNIINYVIRVEFNANNLKPFRMHIFDAVLVDNVGNKVPAETKNAFMFPKGIINHTKPKFYFVSNGTSLKDGAIFRITLKNDSDKQPLRFSYSIEKNTGMLQNIEIYKFGNSAETDLDA